MIYFFTLEDFDFSVGISVNTSIECLPMLQRNNKSTFRVVFFAVFLQ